MAEHQGSMSDEDLAWVTIIIVVSALILIATIVTTRVILSHVAVGSGFGIPILMGAAAGIGFGVVSYLALRAGRGGTRASQAPPQ